MNAYLYKLSQTFQDNMIKGTVYIEQQPIMNNKKCEQKNINFIH